MRRFSLPWLGRQQRLFYREQSPQSPLFAVDNVGGLQSYPDARFNVQASLISSGLDPLLQERRSALTFKQHQQKGEPHRIDSPRDLQVGPIEDCIVSSINQDASQVLECCFTPTQEYIHMGLQSFTWISPAPTKIEVLAGNAPGRSYNCSNIDYPGLLEDAEGRHDEDFHRLLALKPQQGASYDPFVSEWLLKQTDKGDTRSLKFTPRNGEQCHHDKFYGDKIISGMAITPKHDKIYSDKIITELHTGGLPIALKYHGKGLLSGFKHVFQPVICARQNRKPFGALVLSRNIHSTSRLEISQTRPMMGVRLFDIDFGCAKDLSARVTAASSKKLSELYVANLMNEFNRDVRPYFVASCLMLPNQLRHKSTEFLHTQTHKTLKCIPKYIGCRDVMLAKKAMSESDWQQLRDQLIEQRVYLVENWQSTICNVEKLYYDYGSKGPPDAADIYRGECDASFDRNGKATLAYLIWKDDKVIASEIIRGFLCKSAQVAEACAALILLWKAEELAEIQNMLLITDSWHTYGLLSGSLTVKKTDENFGLYMLLRGMHESFDRLSAQWKPRELMFLPDELASRKSTDSSPLYVQTVLKKFSYQLSGFPIFKFSPSTKAKEILTKFEMKPYNEDIESRFYVVAEEEAKIDVLLQIAKTLKPTHIHAAIHHFERKPSGFQQKIARIFNISTGSVSNLKVGEFTVPWTVPGDRFIGPKGCRPIIFVFDLTVPECCYSHHDVFTVFLISPNEITSMRSKGIKELNALSYIYYHGVVEDKVKNVIVGEVEGAEEDMCVEADDAVDVNLLHPKYWLHPDLSYPTREDILNSTRLN